MSACWFLGSDPNFAAQRSEAPAGRAAGSGNLGSDPKNARSRIGSALPESLLVINGRRFAKFRCRSIAAAGDSLFFASPKKPKEKKGDPGSCVGLLGSESNFAAVQSTAPSGEPQTRRIWTLTPKTINAPAPVPERVIK